MAEPIVKISTGQLRGKTKRSLSDKLFYSFQGIPYAKPPIGFLRFKAPVPADSWEGIRDATKSGSICVQVDGLTKTLNGSEDCLTLNVYTQELPSSINNIKKPVMVWIHGGAFVSGSGDTTLYGPDFLLDEDIVLVSINYRLGVLGFLSLEDPTVGVPGNAGLKDMVLALKWVQENIANFGGDANNVTIFGESAGAAAVHFLILSPKAKGLFHKAILQSGCAMNPWVPGRPCAKEIAHLSGMTSQNDKQILEALQALPVEELYTAATKIKESFIASVIRPYGPIIEYNSPDAFLCEDPISIIKSGNYNHVPILMGYNTREGMLSEIIQMPGPVKLPTDFELTIPHFLKLQPGSEISKTVATKIKQFYYGNEKPSADNKDKFYLLEGDNFFVREILRTIKLHLQSTSQPIFCYRMSIETDLNFLKKLSGAAVPGVCHGDDLGYLFKNRFTPDIQPGSMEEIAVKRFVQLWTNFAKYGNPNNPKETSQSLIDVTWSPVTNKQFNFLDIGENLKLDSNPEADRMAFWNNILSVNLVHKL